MLSAKTYAWGDGYDLVSAGAAPLAPGPAHKASTTSSALLSGAGSLKGRSHPYSLAEVCCAGVALAPSLSLPLVGASSKGTSFSCQPCNMASGFDKTVMSVHLRGAAACCLEMHMLQKQLGLCVPNCMYVPEQLPGILDTMQNGGRDPAAVKEVTLVWVLIVYSIIWNNLQMIMFMPYGLLSYMIWAYPQAVDSAQNTHYTFVIR